VGKELRANDYSDAVLHPDFRKHFKSKPKHMGHLGCLFSHIGIYRMVVDQRWGMTIVLEDDAVLDAEFRTQLADRLARVSQVDPNWDLLLLGFSCDYKSYDKCHRNDGADIQMSFIVPVSYFMGTWGYVIRNEDVAAKLLKHMFPVTWCIDHHLCNMIEKKKLKVYGTLPSLAFHPGKWRMSSWGYECFRPYSKYRSDTNG